MKKPGFRWLGPDRIDSIMKVALGKEPADLVVSNGDLVNVYTAEIHRGYSVAVKGDRIAWMGANPGPRVGERTRVIDASGKAIIPGLVDAHCHMLSMISPAEYVKHAMLHGCTTIITEVQEVTFPMGLRAARVFMDYLREQPVKLFFTIPPLVTLSWAAEANFITPKQLARLLADDRVLGLGESYWLPTIQGDKRLLDLFAETLSAGKKLEGHAAGARSDKLIAYFASGITSCHESTTLEETLEKLRLGVSTMIREGSVRSELAAIAKIRENRIDFRMLSLVSDGVSADIFLKKGHMDHIVGQAIAHGIEPVTAIQAATINPAGHFAIDDVIGGIAPGKFADIAVIPDLKTIKPEWVISNGQVVARDGKALVEPPQKKWPGFITNSLKFPREFTAEDFRIKAPVSEGKVQVRVIHQITELVTKELITEVAVRNGFIEADTERDIIMVAAISRVRQPGKIALGLIKGFGLRRGAFASSGSWDCGSVVAVGASPGDMALAVNRLAVLHGGAVVYADGKRIEELPFPLAGVISTLTMEELNRKQEEIQGAVNGLGCPLGRAHLSLDVLTSPAIPHLRMSDAGVFSVRDNSLVDLIVA
ncbi:MAG: adenine deaminase [Chloroflexi bacterium]|nr:adenine deaminase [Chloroflexota bacterium]